jgi:YHS domain-containing protein
MNSIRKYWWTAVALAAFVGCNSEEPAPAGGGQSATPGPAPAAGPSAGGPGSPAPSQTPSAAPGAKPPEAKGETPGTPPPAVEAPNKSDEKKESPKKDEEKKDTPKKDEEKKAANAKLSDDEIAEIKKLPAADQAIALKQILCPVSDEPLGAMGAPIKETVGGKTFFLCCKSCEKDLKKDEKKYLAKLKD